MKATFDQEDVELIAQRVAEIISPLLSCNQQNQDEIFDVTALAAYLRVSRKWIYERTHLKEIPHIKAGGQLRFRKKIINKWLDSYGIPTLARSEAVKSLVQKT
jgi:excisionase family DNA binding protein